MGLPPLSFTGVSKFSDDFQAVLERSFEIATLPISQLQSEQQNLISRQQQLTTLNSAVRDLQIAFQKLGALGATNALTATSTNPEVATASITGSVETLSFEVEVTSAASAAQEATVEGLADSNSTPLSADGLFTLTIGSEAVAINLNKTSFVGSGRHAGTLGSVTPASPVSVQVDFSNGVTGSITADLNSFFVAAAAPSAVGAGDTITVNFISADLAINESVITDPLDGTEDAAAIAARLNEKIAVNPGLDGKVSFSAIGGKLKLVVNDTAGQGFTFTSSGTGTVVSGLESGGTVGGHSAQEIAAALNAQVALNPTLVAAGITFTAFNGEVQAAGNSTFDITASDSPQGTGFSSGLSGVNSTASFANTLEGLRDLINARSETLGLKASIINTSSDPSAPSYHLTLTATETGASTLTLKNSSSTNLLTTGNQGSDAVFTVNGLEVTNSKNTIPNFAPGLSLTIVGEGTATIFTDTDTGKISEGLADIVLKYNAALEAIQTQVGEQAGLLSGAVEVRLAQQALRGATGYVGSGDIQYMAALGLELGQDGQLSFNSFTFNTLSDDTLAAALSFIGSATTGFAGNAISILDALTDPIDGQIASAIDFLQQSDDALTKQIEEAQERVDRLISNLEEKFAAADLLLSQLEAQQSLLTALFRPREERF